MVAIDVKLLVVIFAGVVTLGIIGKGSLFSFIAAILRGAFYILMLSIAVYVLTHYWNDLGYHVGRFLDDVKGWYNMISG